ncbi:MAG: hypothetical protein KJO07_02805, partial [Deltaproteobacteria bacterium]|nr:hypothetical protein [Deltaproteobacteria bacterium]
MSPLALALTALVGIGGASMAPGLAKDRARAERLEAAAATHPGTPAAADELLSAAELYDQRLHDFERAAQLYQRVRTLDGQSRAGQRAAARLERIAPLLAGARGAMAEWSAILVAHDSEVDRETEARASQLLDRYPNWPGVSNVHLWL